MTKDEVERDFQPELAALAAMNKLTYEQTINELTKCYDGYHFISSAAKKSSSFHPQKIFLPLF